MTFNQNDQNEKNTEREGEIKSSQSSQSILRYSCGNQINTRRKTHFTHTRHSNQTKVRVVEDKRSHDFSGGGLPEVVVILYFPKQENAFLLKEENNNNLFRLL